MSGELQPAEKLTIFIGSDERLAHHSLYEAVMKMLHAAGVVGATVFKGVMGFGYTRRIHSDMNEVMMENLPLVIEAVDGEGRLEGVAAQIAEMLAEHGVVELLRTTIFKPPTSEDERDAS